MSIWGDYWIPHGDCPDCLNCPPGKLCPTQEEARITFYGDDAFHGNTRSFQFPVNAAPPVFQTTGGSLCHDSTSPWPFNETRSRGIGFIPHGAFLDGNYSVHLHGKGGEDSSSATQCGQDSRTLCDCSSRGKCDFYQKLNPFEREFSLADLEGGIYLKKCTRFGPTPTPTTTSTPIMPVDPGASTTQGEGEEHKSSQEPSQEAPSRLVPITDPNLAGVAKRFPTISEVHGLPAKQTSFYSWTNFVKACQTYNHGRTSRTFLSEGTSLLQARALCAFLAVSQSTYRGIHEM